MNENDCQSVKLINRVSHSNSENSKEIVIGGGETITMSFIGKTTGIDTIKIANCPTLRERKTCTEYNPKNTKSDIEIIVEVTK
ncbi:hypothetical protein FEDK69T_31620 [Flavobacterium enshiense DK69]|nr:hypothetical protein FEDK69T_31620 [Flavobacterium enshiense DK69]